MLSGLRHYALISGNYKKHKIDPAYSGEHVLYELLVPRYVDYAYVVSGVIRYVGKSEFYRYAAFFLFCEPVSVDPAERFYERCFSVVDMAGSADDYVFHSLFSESFRCCLYFFIRYRPDAQQEPVLVYPRDDRDVRLAEPALRSVR